jgi:hypothetical protein
MPASRRAELKFNSGRPYVAAEPTESSPQKTRGKILQTLGPLCVAGGVTVALYGAYIGVNGEYNINDNTPDTLPEPVAEQVTNAVHLQANLPHKDIVDKSGRVTGFDAWGKSQLSGLYLGNGYYISAGHALREQTNKPYSSLECGNYTISGYAADKKAYTVDPQQSVSTNVGFDNDMSMFRINSDNLKGLSNAGFDVEAAPLQLAQKTPEKGETVYFVNWEPTPDGKERDPRSKDTKLDKPAIFAGVVTDVDDYTVRASTGLKSYGEGQPDDTVRPGASGGMVLNEAGELIGQSNGLKDGSLLDTKWGPFGLPNNGDGQAVITRASQKVIDNAKQMIGQTEPCYLVAPPKK